MRRVSVGAISLLVLALSAPAAGAGSESGAGWRAARDRVHRIDDLRHQEMVARGLRPAPGLPAPRQDTAPLTPAVSAKGVRQISHDMTTPQPGSEPDTQIEPDIAVSPVDPNVVVATFQQGRFPDGGSVDPGFATSTDGGRTWSTGNLPGLTTSVGGRFDRASDPAVTFGPDGAAYITTLPFDAADCFNGIFVSRSDDGGLTWNDPVLAQADCASFDDKNWIAADAFAASPFTGRIYIAWDRSAGGLVPEVLRYSDDRGETWSPLITISSGTDGIGVIPLVQPNGHVTAVYQNLDNGFVVSQTSTDGGDHWGPKVNIGLFQGTEPPDMRTGGLPTATVDPVTGYLYAGWQDARFRSDGFNDILLWRSTDGGASWTGPVKANPDASGSGLDRFTPDIAAYGHNLHVTWLTRAGSGSSFSDKVAETYTLSTDDGATFAPAFKVGPPADLSWAAQAGGRFLGDYMGVAAWAGGAHAVWCRSSGPPAPRTYHQTAWSATFRL
jgi:BNR/Asp-box repeat protein